VFVAEANATDANYVGLPDVRGVKIESYSSETSPAKRAGLEPGDVVIAIDGQPVNYVAQLQQIVGFKRPGDMVKVEVARKGGLRKTLSVRLISAASGVQQPAADRGDAQDETADPSAEPVGAVIRPLGVTVLPLTTQIASEIGTPAGLRGLVVQSVDQEGPAAEVPLFGVESGNPDIILSVEGMPVRTEAELRSALKDAGPGGIVTLVLYNKAVAAQGGGRRVERVQLVR
jgi:serine protease Do